ncbi:MAG: DegT/DnrJ/EryC1/StrS family aminotransferase [Candidatus Sumerlaeota bacterium]|nr:DegT/DnrJ/EryC1/StrS family aminotransferase [Candidatus Sumerlaeota bacterium]
MNVPFLDLKAQYETIRDEIAEALNAVLESGAFAGGPFVEKFEREFASFCECEHAVGVNSGTTALWLALQGLGVGPGDEVITVPNTFIATAEAISLTGARPVFVDVDEGAYTMDPAFLEGAITPATRAIIPVHLYGQPADMDPILAIARRHGLLVIEDACQAHGARYKGKSVGSLGDAGCFSFYPGKNLGAYGEGGAVVTKHRSLADTVRMLRDHGQSQKYYHSLIGINARMDGIQGAVLSVKLKHLPAWNAARRWNADLYNRLLADCPVITPPYEPDYAEHVYHLYVVRTPNRDALMAALKDQGVHCGIHYPLPIHRQKAYESLDLPLGQYPVAEASAAEVLSLPMYAELTQEQINLVVHKMRTTSAGMLAPVGCASAV